MERGRVGAVGGRSSDMVVVVTFDYVLTELSRSEEMVGWLDDWLVGVELS